MAHGIAGGHLDRRGADVVRTGVRACEPADRIGVSDDPGGELMTDAERLGQRGLARLGRDVGALRVVGQVLLDAESRDDELTGDVLSFDLHRRAWPHPR